MAKKASKKSKSTWVWVKFNTPEKPSDAEKEKVTATFAPWIQQQKNAIPPLSQPQKYNEVAEIFTKWRGSHFYVMHYYKCPDLPTSMAKGFESGLARLTYKAPDRYDLAYFRHTGKWWTLKFDLSLGQAFKAVSTDPTFLI